MSSSGYVYLVNLQDNIKNIFLDAGGVILNEKGHESACTAAITRVLSSFVSDYSQEQYWTDVSEAVYRYAPNVYEYVIWKNVPDRQRYEEAVSEFRRLRTESGTPLVLMEGIEEILRRLAQRFRLGILGQYGRELRDLLSENRLLDFFAFPATQEEFSITKPDPRYFEQVLKRAGVLPQESVMVGDRIDKDIIPAKSIGMKTVRMIGGIHRDQVPRTPEEAPDIELTSITDLPRVFGIL